MIQSLLLKRIILLLASFALAKLAFLLFWPDLLQDISFSKIAYDRQGQVLRLTLSGDEKYRLHVENDQIPQAFEQILLFQEDRYFKWHLGVNPVSLLRSLLFVVQGSETSGASTMTMQVARVRYRLHTKTWSGKIQQILYAFAIEMTHSKSEILNAYYQLAPYGKNIEGVSAASYIYFRKKPMDLSLNEMIILALIPKDPNARLKQLEKTKLSESFFIQQQKALREKFASFTEQYQLPVDIVDLPTLSTQEPLPFLAPHFVERALREFPERDEFQTTLDLNKQKIFEKRIRDYLATQENRGLKNAAALLMNWRTQEVLSWVGSADYFNENIQGQIDGVATKRSPGSTLKPFLYALAIQQGLIHPETLLKDAPQSFGGFDPENFDRRFMGPISAENSLIESRNVPAVQLLSKIGLHGFFQFLNQGGLRFYKAPEFYGLGAVLGTTEMSMFELAHLYKALADGGTWQKMKILLNQPASPARQILSPESTWMTLNMLTGARRPSQEYRTAWKKRHIPVAWKTGTSFGFYDAWTAGVVGDYVLVVWIGDFKRESNPNFIGREAAAPLFFQLIDSIATPEMSEPVWTRKDGLNLKQVQVCSVSGQLPGRGCKHTMPTWFIPGTSPIKVCDIHRLIMVNQKTGLRSCDPLAKGNAVQIFEFWPNDLLSLFQLAGIHRKTPPDFDASCGMSAKLSLGSAPQIISPISDVQYVYQKERHNMVFKALADTEVKKLYWFIDDQFVQSVSVMEQALVNMEVGDHEIFVVDDFGRSDRMKVTVTLPQ